MKKGFIIAACCLMFTSCGGLPKKSGKTEAVHELAIKASKTAKEAAQTTKEISKLAEVVEDKRIREAIATLQQQMAALNSELELLNSAAKSSKVETAALVKENKKLQEQLNNSGRKIYFYLMLLGGLGMASAIGLFFFASPKIALPVLASSAGLFIIARFLERFEFWLMFAVWAILIATTVYILWSAWRHKAGLREVVATVEKSKLVMDEPTRRKIFGENQIADETQSEPTKKLVKEIRENLQ
jgi:regulator of replication initiation timing